VRLTRIYRPIPLATGSLTPLDERAYQYLTRVMRLSLHDEVVVFNGQGQEHRAQLTKSAQGHWLLEILEPLPLCPDSPLKLRLVQGISRGERMDYAIQKATELGVSHLQPVACERSVVRLKSDQAERRLAHWQAVAIASAEQSKRHSVPEVLPILPYAEYLSLTTTAERVVLDPLAPHSLRDFIPKLPAIDLIIGPEGGLSEAELALAIETKATRLRLGPRVLRTETAAAAAITALQLMHGDLQ
jgi:16S rRNA (uracil1498-N3)-methyltransferase